MSLNGYYTLIFQGVFIFVFHCLRNVKVITNYF